MDKVMAIFQWILANYQILLSALVGVCSSLIAVFMLIPGEQPEKFLQGAVDFLSKFSKK